MILSENGVRQCFRKNDTFCICIFFFVNFSCIFLFFVAVYIIRPALKSDPTLNTRALRIKIFLFFRRKNYWRSPLEVSVSSLTSRSCRIRRQTQGLLRAHRAEKSLPPSWMGEKCPAVKKRSWPFDFWRAICRQSRSSWFGLTNQVFSTRCAAGTKCNFAATCNQRVPREEYINQRWILQLLICECTRRRRRCKGRRCLWARWDVTTTSPSRLATSITIIITTSILSTRNVAR